jgi:hypothetical protein
MVDALKENAMQNLRVLENIHAYLMKHADKLPPFTLASLEVQIDRTRIALGKAVP